MAVATTGLVMEAMENMLSSPIPSAPGTTWAKRVFSWFAPPSTAVGCGPFFTASSAIRAAFSRCLRSSGTLVVRADGNAIEIHLVLLHVKLHAALPQLNGHAGRGLFHGKLL